MKLVKWEHLIIAFFFLALLIPPIFRFFSSITPGSRTGGEISGLVYSHTEPAGEITAEGVMMDESGEPLIGGTVSLQGTSIGTVSDMEGRFRLQFSSGAPENPVLEFMYTGFKKLSLPFDITKGNHLSAIFILEKSF